MMSKTRGLLRKWFQRHTTLTNRLLHVAGIGSVLASLPLAFIWRRWLLALVLFVGGYLLQIVGHILEGSPVGEWLLLKRLLKPGSDSSRKEDKETP